MMWLKWVGPALCLLAAAGAGASTYGAKRWSGKAWMLARGLDTARADAGAEPRPTHHDRRELEGLPAPVQRYFRTVLRDGQPVIAGAVIELAGSFNMSADGEQWKRFTSRQRVATHRPGFLWDAQIAMFPGLTVRVIDSYIAGQGLLHAALLGLFTMADTRGGGEIARGELMRYFAEAPWYPTALLPSQGVRWEAVDDRSANATLVDGAFTLTLLFRFNDVGLIDSFRAESRGGAGAGAGKDIVMLPWEGSFSNYQQRDGMMVPWAGEVAWMRPEGRKPYFAATVTALTYQFVA